MNAYCESILTMDSSPKSLRRSRQHRRLHVCRTCSRVSDAYGWKLRFRTHHEFLANFTAISRQIAVSLSRPLELSSSRYRALSFAGSHAGSISRSLVFSLSRSLARPRSCSLDVSIPLALSLSRALALSPPSLSSSLEIPLLRYLALSLSRSDQAKQAKQGSQPAGQPANQPTPHLCF